MSERGFKGIWIPSPIWLSRELSLLEKVFFAEIDSLDNPPKGCIASNAYFSDFFSLSREYVSRQVSKLEAKGLINCEYDKENNRTIRVTVKGRALLADIPESMFARRDNGVLSDPSIPIVQTINTYCPNGQYPIVQMDKHITKGDNKEDNKDYISGNSAQAPAKRSRSAVFVTPTIPEAEEYLREIGSPGEGAAFVDYHTARGWLVGRTGMKDWKAAARTWKRNGDRIKAEGGSARGSLRPAAVNFLPIIAEVEAAFASKKYYSHTTFNPASGRQESKSILPEWSNPAIKTALDAMGGFFQLRERVTQGTYSPTVWKNQLERYYRQALEGDTAGIGR